MTHFHARIFAPAIDHYLPVQPLAIHYFDEQGNVHPNVTWRDESFMNNLMGILGCETIHAELTFLPVMREVNFQKEDVLLSLQRKGCERFCMNPKDGLNSWILSSYIKVTNMRIMHIMLNRLLIMIQSQVT